MKIGVFGGTFDPPHIGHLILADEACGQLDLDYMLWMPTACPPHKTGEDITDIQHRLDMVRSAIDNNPRFQLSKIEIDRPHPQYTVDTMRFLQYSHPKDDLIYLMGGDSLINLHKWHEPRKFVDICSALGVMPRPGTMIDLEVVETDIPGIQQKIEFVKAPLIDISGSQIRSRIKIGMPYRYFLPEHVFEIIEIRKLYR